MILDFDTSVLFIASFAGAFLNAVAGGGTFITFPALVSVGIPPIAANATSTSVLLSGYIASSWGFRRQLSRLKSTEIINIVLVTVAGAVIGSLLLVFADNHIFNSLLPWLMLLATLLFCFAPLITSGRASASSVPDQSVLLVVLFALACYGGFFSGGLGIMILAAFSILGYRSINNINALKNIISLILTTVAVLIYFLGGLIQTSYLLVMIMAAVGGGTLGACVGQRLPVKLTRAIVICIGTALTIYFFIDG